MPAASTLASCSVVGIQLLSLRFRVAETEIPGTIKSWPHVLVVGGVRGIEHIQWSGRDLMR